MNFIYLVEWDFTGYSGVERKIIAQMKTWEDQGHNCRSIIVGRHSSEQIDLYKNRNIDFWRVPQNRLINKILLAQVIKQLYFFLIFLKYYRKKYDFCFYRISTLSFAFIMHYAFPFFIDINSMDAEAVSGLKKLIQPLGNLYRKLLLTKSQGVFFVTEELQNYFENKYSIRIAHKEIIGNGYYDNEINKDELAEYFARKAKKEYQKPVILFVGTGDYLHYWFGFDKMEKLVEELFDYEFLLVGEINGTKLQDYPNVTMIPKMNKKNILDIYYQADIGIGALALHRKKMNEGSALKVAEYIYFGLPVITAYSENNARGSSYNLEIENTEDNLSEKAILEIREFVEKNFRRILFPEERLPVSLGFKEAQRLQFIQSRIKDSK